MASAASAHWTRCAICGVGPMYRFGSFKVGPLRLCTDCEANVREHARSFAEERWRGPRLVRHAEELASFSGGG